MRLQHATAAAVFVALACVVSWPLAAHLSTHLPGRGIGDNAQFLWNFWWMRTALAESADFFHTPYLFAPFGTDLTLHTHTALPAFLGATLFGALPVLTAHNLMILVSLALNGFCAYLLAWRTTRDVGAAMLAGVTFGASPYVAAHLNGHFNLIAAWTLPLFILALQAPGGAGLSLEARGTRAFTPRRGAIAGVVLALTAYVDYYYVVYQLALAAAAWAWTTHEWRWGARGPTTLSRRLALASVVLAGLDLLLLAAIALTGGFRAELGSLTISARSAFNPLQIFWILVACAAACYWRPFVHASAGPRRRPAALAIAAGLALAAALAAPVLWHGATILASGEYVTQQYFWRSAPHGVDLSTLFIGHPFHGVWGGPVRDVYERLGIDAIESSAWMGLVPLMLAGFAVRYAWGDGIVREWTGMGALFFLWALGPHLVVLGVNSGIILPQTALRYVPIAANARVPGRAVVLAGLAVAMLAAIAASRWRRSPATSHLALGAAALTLLEFLPSPFPLALVEQPAIYTALRHHPAAGALLELPAGTRDSFQTQGALDHRTLAFQMLHGRPIVGGVVSRLSPVVVSGYDRDPVLGPMIRASGPGASLSAQELPDRPMAIAGLVDRGIAFVLVNRETAPPGLAAYVQDVLRIPVVAHEGPRTLYRVGLTH